MDKGHTAMDKKCSTTDVEEGSGMDEETAMSQTMGLAHECLRMMTNYWVKGEVRASMHGHMRKLICRVPKDVRGKKTRIRTWDPGDNKWQYTTAGIR